MTRITMLIAIAAGAATAMGDQREVFFESRIRPVLVEHCYSCHSADAKQLRGGLLLDSSESTLAGGDSGPAIIPGQPEESLLVSALRHESFEMPPDRRLPEEIINDFRKWIRDGAFDPRQGGKVVKRTSIDLEQGRQFWSFQPVRRPNIPAVSSDWPVNEIDHFVAARHNGAAVQPAQDAEPWQIV
ncbi:MAG: hypothetical protein KDA66_21525, partial [Planctomycetaceae bacterium]|nr:hypothetical protein [Planctomycetaceae bacterium]